MAKKVEIELDVKGNIVESTKNLRALKTELKNVAAGTAEWNKIKNDIRDIEDALESAGQSSEDFKGLLENAPGPLGVLGGAIKKVELATKSWGAALKATGIGLLVSLIGGLVAAFSQTEGSLKKLEPLLIGMEKIFGGIVEIFTPLLDAFLDMGLKALPYITKGIGMLYSSLVGLFTYIKEVGTGVAKFWKGVFTLDYKSIEEGVKQIGGSFGKVADSYNDSMKRFEDGTKKQTKTQKENADKQKEINDKLLADKLKNMEAEDKLDEARMEKMKAEALALATTEQQKLDIEKAFSEKIYKLKSKDLDDKMALYKKDSVEYKALQEQKIKLETDYINTTKANKDKQKELNDKARKDEMDAEIGALNLKKAEGTIKEDAYQESLYLIKKKYTKDKKELNDIEIAYEQYKFDKKKKLAEDERSLALMQLQSQMNDLDKKNALLDYDFQEDLLRLEEKRTLLEEAQKKELAGVENNEIERNKILQKYSDLRKGIDAEEVATTKAAEEAKHQVKLAYLQAAQGFGALLQSIADGNKDLAITGLLIEKAAALASLTISAYKNFGKDGGITSPLAWANLAVAGVNAAAIVVASVKGINDIKNAGKGSSTGDTAAAAAPAGNSAQALGKNYGDGGMIDGPRHAQGGTLINAEGGEAVMTRGAVTMFAPLLSTLNQMGGGTSFAPNALTTRYDAPNVSNPAQEQSPLIMKTYVVSNELTTEAEKQARLKDLSTL